MSRPDSDSPNKLENGRWILRGRIQVWEQGEPEPESEQPATVPDECRDCELDISGTRQHSGRGLCHACYKRHLKAGTIYDFPRFRKESA